MADFNFADLAQSAGTTTGTWAKDIANSAADFACGLYAHHHNWVINQLDPTGISGGFGNGLMSSLCNPRTNTPAPQSTAGNVVCWRFSGTDVQQAYTYDLYVCGIKAEYRVTGNNPNNSQAMAPYVDGSFVGVQSTYSYYPGSGTITQVANDSVGTGANYTYGNCTGCNNVSSTPTTTTPSPQELTVNTTVNNINTQAKFVHASADVGLVINVGGVNVRFDHTGATINNAGDQYSTTQNNAVLNSINTTVNTVNQNQNTLIFAPSGTLVPTYNTPAQNGNKQGITGMRIITLELTNRPKNAATTYGGEAGTIYKAGWFYFTYNNHIFGPEPIRYQLCAFLVPQGANGYAYNLYPGFTGQVTEYNI